MMPASRLTRIVPRLLLALAASAVAAGLSLTGFAGTVELKTYDWRVRQTTAARLSASSPVTVVAIDDESLRRMEPLVGRWPWPRLVHATVIDFLSAAGARAVVYDVLFAERDRRTFMVGETEWTGEESDQALVDSTRAAGMVVHAAEAASSGTRDAARALEPALADDILGGVRYADSRQIRDPFALSQRYLLLFQQRGGKLVRGDAQSLQAERNQWRLDSDEGACVAPQAVLALGPQGGDLARRLGYRLPLGQKRGYHMHYAAPSVPLRHTIVDVDNGYALAPVARGIRLTTGAEFALRDAPATPVQLEMVEPIARRLASVGARLDAQPWLGSRPCTADMLPLLGPAPRHRGLWFSFGHAHHGLTQAASSGRLMAELLCGETPYIDPTPYRVDRF